MLRNANAGRRAMAVRQTMMAARHASAGLVVSAIALGAVKPLQAATVTNVDTRDHVLSVRGVHPPKSFHIARGASTQNVCPKGCVVRLNGSTDHDYRIEGGELISIEDGALYYDGDIKVPKEPKDDAATKTTPATRP